MKFTVRQLEAFRAVATELHFGRAASSLRLSQPTVSKELHRLERALDLELFQRSSGGTALTAEGEELLPHAERALDALARLGEAASTVKRRLASEVRVATSPSIVNRLMPEILRYLEVAHPQLSITTVEVETGEVGQAVENGEADVGLGHHVGPVHSGHVRTIGHDEVYVLIAEELVGPDVAAVDLARLEKLPLLLWPREHNPAYYDALLTICHDRRLDPLILTGTSRISGSRSYFLHDGRAFSLVPRDFALAEAPDLRAVPLSVPGWLPLDVAWVDPLSPASRILLQEVEKVATSAREQDA
ncbi:LysR family transcriptional regulator [Amycolatopsis palatopharyngis]|uniref:LysR family transcriptional regulator n=1 Tax=Amycolatopsis palatopharyngis TaxID=187982 RepID=UPI000E257CEC|nr:LysR family transcriptional regulator [Amycolatopsis palatopharyngis]